MKQFFIFIFFIHFSLGAILLPEPGRRFHGSPKPPIERKDHYPLLSGNTFRSFCDLWVDETRTDFDPLSVKKGNAVFVSMKYLRFFLNTILPEIEHEFILVTSNENEFALSTFERTGAIDDSYLPNLESGKIFQWFGRNIVAHHPKLSCIPLGVTWLTNISHSLIQDCFSALNIETYFSNKPIDCYLNIRRTHPSRIEVLNHFSKQKFCTISKSIPFETYMSHLTTSRFVISPRGFNLDCFRTWEALYAGAIPVVESMGIDGIYEGLPIIIVDDLRTVTKEFLEAEFEKLKGKTFHLERLHAQYWLDQIKEAQDKCITRN